MGMSGQFLPQLQTRTFKVTIHWGSEKHSARRTTRPARLRTPSPNLVTWRPQRGAQCVLPAVETQGRGAVGGFCIALCVTLISAEIQHCLVSAGDVGCGVFECFENNSCEIRGLHGICMTFLHNAGKFDAQGKSFIKDALRCKAHALRHRFGCISRKCPAIREMVLQLQRECYLKHDLCAAARDNTRVMVEMIHFKDLLLRERLASIPNPPAPRGQPSPPILGKPRPYVDLVNLLLTCGEEVKAAVTHSVQAQCEQNWGSLCSIHPWPRPPEPPTSHRGAKGERGSKSAPNAHGRARAAAHGAQGTSGSSEWEDEQAEYSDIRR
ncbi:PREDICTED: stanniocalcin-2 [Myotis davidii]|uniref:stanniocalcin-2 n=1 Tax=Myotis davidii TaxID=225400 RepID=UPI000767008A|nr:PREDICTED: stanniocalcin-2 [Myotis davidii]